ncbi:Pimeloyl-ACP methyl ester carboxylesterase [Nocardioides terrae]|uniref:Pimeloyl-ACP methyl ester carboxylesterase n=1 Tax=Nocardioides terrae TaxID=574651 RepID=A0A1I1DAQ6_9ACTN|nr:alpha/beta fold hydrolase [Nocardioides terrae]SFB71894.1 Pimeloyl-ACP methyl ester carboxylesterase [Nocardioides terrae]
MSDLHVLRLGETGSRVVFLHGLFGQGRNWMTIAKGLSDRHRVALVDLPNHGRSAWTEHVDYLDMAAQVAALLKTEGPATVVGHSMGGKVAMVLALTRPDLVERLVVADMSPVDYGDDPDATDGVLGYARILLDLDLSRLARREDADNLLAEQVSDPTIRAFLLQNLRREGQDGWRWAANLEAIVRDGTVLSGWPAEALAGHQPYAGRVLWLAGETSGYVQPAYDETMRHWFPHYRKVTIKGAGHWLHSEKPDVFLATVQRFLGD